MTVITDWEVETDGVCWLAALGWQVAYVPDIAPGTPNVELGDYGQADDFIGK